MDSEKQFCQIIQQEIQEGIPELLSIIVVAKSQDFANC
jgi:hypothetical protein